MVTTYGIKQNLYFATLKVIKMGLVYYFFRTQIILLESGVNGVLLKSE